MSEAGRPPKFTSAEEMQKAIDAYFSSCLVSEKPLTISGLAYALDMSTESLRRYGEKDAFCATVKRAKQKVEIYLEERLDSAAPTGAIFNLKNNFGWKDKTEQEVNATLDIQAIEYRIVDQPDD